MSTIWVVGSLNADYVVEVERMPKPGETVRGGDLVLYPGGKGGNQAVAAARLGGDVRMIGLIGNDSSGEFLINSLTGAGVNTEGVGRSEAATGSALIYVALDGDNSIVISPGANGRVSTEYVEQALAGISSGDLLLCQLEVPLVAVEAALAFAGKRGATTMLDPAPAAGLSDSILQNVDILTPNETEAATLLGAAAIGSPDDASQQLRDRGPNTVIVKLGESGCVVNDGQPRSIPAIPVEAVDTTAAGDTFNAALAVQLGRGIGLDKAARWANVAAGISVTRRGAQSSAPTREEVEIESQRSAADE